MWAQLRSCVQLFARLLCPWNFPGKNTEVGCHFLLQGIFLTQGSNLHLLHLFILKKIYFWNSLAVQWLRFFDLTSKDPGLIPGQGSKIPQALQGNQKYLFNK